MCLGLWPNVYRPRWVTPHSSNIAMVASSSDRATPRFQTDGATVSGPKKPTLPQRVTKFVPTRSPSTSAASAALGSAAQRVRTKSPSPMKSIGSGRPRKVPKASRRIWSASGRSRSSSLRIVTPASLFDVVMRPSRTRAACDRGDSVRRGQSRVRAPVVKGQRAAAEDGADGERALGLDDGGDGQDLAQQQLLVAGQVRHHRLDQEVTAPGDQVAGDDGGDGQQGLLDPNRALLRMAADLEADEHGQAEAGRRPAD